MSLYLIQFDSAATLDVTGNLEVNFARNFMKRGKAVIVLYDCNATPERQLW